MAEEPLTREQVSDRLEELIDQTIHFIWEDLTMTNGINEIASTTLGRDRVDELIIGDDDDEWYSTISKIAMVVLSTAASRQYFPAPHRSGQPEDNRPTFYEPTVSDILHLRGEHDGEDEFGNHPTTCPICDNVHHAGDDCPTE